MKDRRLEAAAGRNGQYILMGNVTEVNEWLAGRGCRPIDADMGEGHFSTELPQEVRDEMERRAATFAVRPADGMLFRYVRGVTSLSLSEKYLRPFSEDGVEIEINGRTYSYFMTNDRNKLADRLRRHGCLPPKRGDWRRNLALDKRVTDKMAELGAKWSLTTSNGAEVLNLYDGEVPFIIHLRSLRQKSRKTVFALTLDCVIKDDDDEKLLKIVRDKAAAETPVELSPSITIPPLQLAAFRDSPKSARRLVELGADVNAADKEGRTALMLAAANGSERAIRVLLECGADKKMRTRIGWTARDYALVYEHKAAAELLSDGEGQADGGFPAEKMSFHDRLGFFIARFISTGQHRTSEIYKSLHGFMSKQTFSKLQSRVCHPSKANVILLSLGLGLSLADTETLLSSAGYVLSEKDGADKIVRAFIAEGKRDVFALDGELWRRTGTTLSRSDKTGRGKTH